MTIKPIVALIITIFLLIAAHIIRQTWRNLSRIFYIPADNKPLTLWYCDTCGSAITEDDSFTTTETPHKIEVLCDKCFSRLIDKWLATGVKFECVECNVIYDIKELDEVWCGPDYTYTCRSCQHKVLEDAIVGIQDQLGYAYPDVGAISRIVRAALADKPAPKV